MWTGIRLWTGIRKFYPKEAANTVTLKAWSRPLYSEICADSHTVFSLAWMFFRVLRQLMSVRQAGHRGSSPDGVSMANFYSQLRRNTQHWELESENCVQRKPKNFVPSAGAVSAFIFWQSYGTFSSGNAFRVLRQLMSICQAGHQWLSPDGVSMVNFYSQLRRDVVKTHQGSSPDGVPLANFYSQLLGDVVIAYQGLSPNGVSLAESSLTRWTII